MATAKELIKKHRIAIYVNKNTSGEANWVRIAKATEFTRQMNPVTEERDYIADEHPTTELMDYKPSEDLSITTYKGERDFDLLYELYKSRAIGSEARREVLFVYMFDNVDVTDDDGKTTTYFYADKSDGTLVLNEWNTSGTSISATLYENGTPAIGYVELDENGSPVFTEGEMPTAA